MTGSDTITIFKIGGNVVDNPSALDAFAKDFAGIEGKKILVHGGGKEATGLNERLGIKTVMIEGRRVTDRSTLDSVTMVYAGLINKRIVTLLQAEGVDALGLTGADADVIRAARRSPYPIDYGFVGDIAPEGVNVEFINFLLTHDIVPVFCAIMHNGEGQLLNCNADGVASAVAIALAKSGIPTELIYCFEKDGVLRDIDDASSLIASINASEYAALKEQGIINKGMIPKIDTAFKAIAQGVEAVTIKNSANITNSKGTRLSPI